jgi:hypothetical protein
MKTMSKNTVDRVFNNKNLDFVNIRRNQNAKNKQLLGSLKENKKGVYPDTC